MNLYLFIFLVREYTFFLSGPSVFRLLSKLALGLGVFGAGAAIGTGLGFVRESPEGLYPSSSSSSYTSHYRRKRRSLDQYPYQRLFESLERLDGARCVDKLVCQLAQKSFLTEQERTLLWLLP